MSEEELKLLKAQVLQTQRAAMVEDGRHSQDQLSHADSALFHSAIIPFVSHSKVVKAVKAHKENIIDLRAKIEAIDKQISELLDI